MEKQYGRFSPTGQQYIITNPATPRPWYNYLWNGRHVSLFSQLGQGESFSQDGMGNRIPLVAARMLFLRDAESGEFWSANGLPLPPTSRRFKTSGRFRCTHGLGHSTIKLQQNNIATSFRIFVPSDELAEIWTLRVANQGQQARHLQIFPFIDTLLDGLAKPQAYYMSSGYWLADHQAVVVSADCDFDGMTRSHNFMMIDCPVAGYDSRERAFVGYGTWQSPDALANAVSGIGIPDPLSNSDCEMEKPILALQTNLTLEPGEETAVHILIGTAFSHNEMGRLRAKFLSPEHVSGIGIPDTNTHERVSVSQNGVEWAYGRLQTTIQSELGQTAFTTPDKQLNNFASHWLKRQISLGTQWARVRHNGFRDYMQDIGAMAFFNPRLALERFERVLAFQYSSGYAPRTWLHGRILDKDFADNPVWIPATAYNLVMETGDLTILDRLVPFNDGQTVSIYEHVRRAVNYLWQDRGAFGLCRIRSGDWNDCLDQVGNEGRGVSVWLSMAWLWANHQFAELARLAGETEHAAIAEQRAAEMREAIERHGWDGAYYLRAFDDNGRSLGSHTNKQGTLFLNTQTWAVLAGLERGRNALEFAENRLQTDLGILSVENAYSEYDPKIGLMSRKTPGIQENGGVYLHASAFKLVADCLLRRREAVERGLMQMLPFGRDGEPYVFSNCYFAIENSYRYGTSGQSWGTGTAGWFYSALLNHVFGLQPEIAGLRLNPCLPPSWRKCGVVRPFRGAIYHISYQQKGEDGPFDSTQGKRIAHITVNGREWPDVVLPYKKGEAYQITVVME